MKRKIFLFSGPAGCGKNTASEVVKDFGGVEYAFADPLKDVVALVYGLDRSLMNNFEYKQSYPESLRGKSVRDALQLLGTEGFRVLVSDSTWVDYMIRRIKASKNMIIAIPDVRFINEYEHIKKEFGASVCLISIERNTEGPKLEGDHKAHASEAYFSEIASVADYTIPNNSTLKDFQNLIRMTITTEIAKAR